MAEDPLREDMKADGKALLELSQSLGMAPLAAAWLYDHDIGEWRYYLASPLVDIVGRKAAYDGLARTLAKSEISSRISIVDVYLAGTADFAFRVIGACISVDRGSQVLVKGCEFNGIRVDAYIYQFEQPDPDADVAMLEKTFRRSVRSLRDTSATA